MKVNAIKFFRTITNTDKPKPTPNIRTRFESVPTGKKLDRMA